MRVRRANAVGDRIFIDGNNAAALGCIYGGATVCAWYPITPSSSLAEAFQKHCRKYRVDAATGRHKYAIVQAEDELASIGIVIGAAWNGARAFTATSGPGISLMQEFIGLAYFAEIPAVLFDIQRGSPSTGMPTRTQQADLLLCAYASHGDTKHVLLFPRGSDRVLHDGGRRARPRRSPADADLRAVGPRHRDAGVADRAARRGTRIAGSTAARSMSREELDAGKEFGRYLDVDGDGIPFRTYPGTHPTKGSFFTRGTTKDRYARYTEEGPAYVDNMQRLLRKFETAKELVPAPVIERAAQPTRAGVIWFGSTGAAMAESLATLAADGIHLDRMRLRAFPFADAVAEFIAAHDKVFVVEQNRDAQLRMMLVNECGIDPDKLIPVLHYDGTPITARFITDEIAEKAAVFNVKPMRKVAS